MKKERRFVRQVLLTLKKEFLYNAKYAFKAVHHLQ
jgi:hypothetical protein